MAEKITGSDDYDVIVIGGGHNGLVAGTYLAKESKKVLVLEKRGQVGGIAISEEFFPGFSFSSLVDDAGAFSAEIVKDLNLTDFGFDLLPSDPLILSLLPDGGQLTVWHDLERSAEEISKYSAADAAAYPKFVRWMQKITSIVAKMNSMIPPDLPDVARADLKELSGFLGPVRNLGWKNITQVIRLMPMSVSDLLDEWFESDVLKGAIAASAILNASYGPQEINSSAYAFLTNWANSRNRLFRSSGQLPGGMGTLSKALAASFKSQGGEILLNAEVAKIEVSNSAVSGVTLRGGETISATIIVSAADMRTTFTQLLDPYYLEAKFVKAVNNIKYQGSAMRIHFALDRLPEFTALKDNQNQLLSGHLQIAPSIEYIQKAYDPIKYGEYSKKPYLDLSIPTLNDPSLAPENKHILSATVKYMPYHLADADWGQLGEEVTQMVIETISEYAPDFPACIAEHKTITPLDHEKTYGFPEGNLNHGEMTLNQFFWMRPIPGYAQYRGPVVGLYLCGPATHPGGAITGLNGGNAAWQILSDSE